MGDVAPGLKVEERPGSVRRLSSQRDRSGLFSQRRLQMWHELGEGKFTEWVPGFDVVHYPGPG